MTHEDDEIRGSIRRVGAKDRKKRIKTTGPLIPPEDTAEDSPQSLSTAPEPDEAQIDIIEPPHASADPDAYLPPAPRIYTPPEERFPPVAPVIPEDESVPTGAAAPRKSHRVQNVLTVFFVLATLAVLAYFAFLWENFQSPLNPFAPPTPIPVVVTATPEGTPPAPQVDPRAFSLRLVESAYSRASQGCDYSGLIVEAADIGAGTLLRVQGGSVDTQVTLDRDRTEIRLSSTPDAVDYVVQLFAADGTPLSNPETASTRDTCAENTLVLRFDSDNQ